MTEVFLHVPEQHAGNPVTLPEVASTIRFVGEVPFGDIVLNVGGFMTDEEGAWFYMWTALLAGVPSYVQLPSVGRWVRIPANYWSDRKSQFPPVLFEGMPEAIGHDPEMIGQPIVVWQGAFDVLATTLFRVAAMIQQRAENNDFDAWDLCTNTLPSMIQLVSAEQAASPAVDSGARKAEEQRLADHFDNIGVGKRHLMQSQVAAIWDPAAGPVSAAITIKALMKGKRAGRPSRPGN